jgi:hypothetical protein
MNANGELLLITIFLVGLSAGAVSACSVHAEEDCLAAPSGLGGSIAPTATAGSRQRPGYSSEAACHTAGTLAKNSEKSNGSGITFFCLVGPETPGKVPAAVRLHANAMSLKGRWVADLDSAFCIDGCVRRKGAPGCLG